MGSEVVGVVIQHCQCDFCIIDSLISIQILQSVLSEASEGV
jgi:hypothetical protein